MAYDRLSYQSIRSASGGCMAGRDHWRGKQCARVGILLVRNRDFLDDVCQAVQLVDIAVLGGDP